MTTTPTSPTDAAACLALAQRQVGDVAGWTPEQWQAQLVEDSLQRGDPPATRYRPYRTAVAYLLRPGAVKSRSEGDVSEQYADLTPTVERLRDLDTEWAAHRLPAVETPDPDTFDGSITWGSW
ncbi:hypothetical protein [uncultured Deinococcus sp.]|uniref:hypothetical protein n=1 Tax=uncultured Deinococcus sp. TaxID=158789 RepID=UPI00258B8E8D|nr:hypothetical protein [uncultured Deinococcus sp.]